MPIFRNGRQQQTVDIQMSYRGETLTFRVRPEGPLLERGMQYQVEVDSMLRLAQRVSTLEKRRDGGTLTAEEHGEAYAELDGLLKAGDIEQAVFTELASTLRARRDGKPITPEEYAELDAEIRKWSDLIDFKGVSVKYIKAAAVGWDYYAENSDGSSGDELPLTFENLNRLLTDGEALLAARQIRNHYMMLTSEGKESSENLPGGSRIKMDSMEASPISSSSTGSQKTTEPATLITFQEPGQSADTAKPS